VGLGQQAEGEGETPFRIAYTDADGSLCVADVSTEARSCILDSTASAELRELAWSPDGTMIAVHRALITDSVQDDDDVVVVAADGSDELPNGRPSPMVLFSETRAFGTPQWSSDSTRVASLTEGEFGARYISVANVSDGDADQLEAVGVSQFIGLNKLAWSPDGRVFAAGVFTSDFTPALVTIDADSGASTTLKEFDPGLAGGSFNGVSWSPDGQQILFTRTPSPPSLPWTGTGSEHWIIGRDGSDARKLYDSPNDTGPLLEARFSPDGSTIAFDGIDANGVENIYLIRTDGTNMRQITSSTAGARRPRWWPQAGTHLLAFDGDTVTISVISSGSVVETGAPRPLFFGNNYEWAPAWGTLPPDAVLPTPTAEPVPPSPPLAEGTPVSPPVTAGTSVPPLPGNRIIAPDTGSGTGAGSRGVPGIYWLALAAPALVGGVALLLKAHRR